MISLLLGDTGTCDLCPDPAKVQVVFSIRSEMLQTKAHFCNACLLAAITHGLTDMEKSTLIEAHLARAS